MKYPTKLFVISILAVTLGGCTSAIQEPESSQVASGNRPAAASVPIDANKDPDTVNKVILPKDENGNPIADPAANTDVNATVTRRNAKLEGMRKAAEAGPVKYDEEALLKKAARPAPEDSEFAVILTNAAVERRTFKGHPQLLKVEKRSSGGESVLRIFLRNGKVIDLPGEAVPQLGTESSAKIFELSGTSNGAKAGGQ